MKNRSFSGEFTARFTDGRAAAEKAAESNSEIRQKKRIEPGGRFSGRKEAESEDQKKRACVFRLALAAGLCYNLLMDMKNITKKYIGCHLSAAKGFEAMGKAAVSTGANTFAFFTRNPRGGKAKAIDEKDVEKLLAIMEENCFGKLVAHAPYTLNPCSATAKTREFARMAMYEDMKRMEYLPGNYYNFHPGSHVGQGTEKGIQMIAELLNEIITPQQTTTVLLETMAGKGSEIGGRFEELAAILERVKLSDKVGVCLDTCHVSDGGYDIIQSLDGVLDEFDQVIGIERLKAMHINDSQNSPGSHKDRHACIGEGTIGKEAILRIVNHPRLIGLPCILETPQPDLSGYGREIKMLMESRD